MSTTTTPAAEREAPYNPRMRADDHADAITLGQRMRRARLHAGVSRETVAEAIGRSPRTYRGYELGSARCPSSRLPLIAAAIGCPVAQLFTDELVLAEVRASAETLERARAGGAPVAEEVGARIASGIAALLLAEASRPAMYTGPGARARTRRRRPEYLEGIAAARRRTAELKAQRRADDVRRVE